MSFQSVWQAFKLLRLGLKAGCQDFYPFLIICRYHTSLMAEPALTVSPRGSFQKSGTPIETRIVGPFKQVHPQRGTPIYRNSHLLRTRTARRGSLRASVFERFLTWTNYVGHQKTLPPLGATLGCSGAYSTGLLQHFGRQARYRTDGADNALGKCELQGSLLT